jgi:hypothetical protein
METDIGNPIHYSPDINVKDDESVGRDEDAYYHQQQQQQMPMMHPMMHMYPPPPPSMDSNKLDFSNLDKNTYIVMFIAFIVGFFMGKTMQPVILRAM